MSTTVEIVPEERIRDIANIHGYVAPFLRRWAGCRCSTNHKTTATWIKCRLNFYHDNGENKHKPSFTTHHCDNREPWLVLVKTYSGDYYTTHNDKSNNCGYFTYEVYSFESHRGALNKYHQLNTEKCWLHDESPSQCYARPCRFVEPYVVYIERF